MKTCVTLVATALVTTPLLNAPASAASPPLSHPAVLAHFDLAAGQLPENVVLAGDEDVDVTFAGSRQVARVGKGGTTTVLGTLPAPSQAEGQSTPVLHFPLTTGLVRTPTGRLYALYAAGTSRLTGLWEIRAGQTPRRVAGLPGNSLPNGMALSGDRQNVYVADSALGLVYKIRLQDGAVRRWASGPGLEPDTFLGANGINVHNGAVWVSNLDHGTLVRIDVTPKGDAGARQTVARGLAGIDDFAFIGKGDLLLAALNQPNTVELVRPGQGHRTVLTAADGLQGPTAVAVQGTTAYITRAAYNTQQDPNVLTARLDRR